MAAVGRVLLYCQNFSCRCDMHLDPRLVPAVVISRLKTINIFKYNDSDSLGRFFVVPVSVVSYVANASGLSHT
jgi:hypothetical protein